MPRAPGVRRNAGCSLLLSGFFRDLPGIQSGVRGLANAERLQKCPHLVLTLLEQALHGQIDHVHRS